VETPRRPKLTPRLRDWLIVLACLAAHAVYLIVARLNVGRFGFPLDDAWIYQTYARNLATTGQWAFVPGVPSTGSTSVLWTLLVTPAYLLRLNPFWWTQGLGLVALIGTALGAARLFEDDPLRTSLIVGLAVSLEWHLIWAAASGMETGLFTALVVWFWAWLRRHDPALVGHRAQDGLLVGLWGGLLMLARPEGILALAAAGIYGLLVHDAWWRRLGWGLLAGIGLGLVLVPFLTANHLISGQWWPNTFYAKQMEYAALWQQPFLQRLSQQATAPLVGAQALLLPGLIYELVHEIRQRSDPVSLAPWLWVLLHLAAYAARLPVTYQHGRYAIPVIPLIVIYGSRGVLRLARPFAPSTLTRVASRAWMVSLAVLFPLVAVALGAPAYARDVRFIEREMVEAARWVRDHTSPDSVIAAHDIGALGYYASRPLVDLAGLVSPEVVPWMGDAEGLTAFILSHRAEYLIAFPRWSDAYTTMLASPHFCPVWNADQAGYVSDTGLGPLTIYRVSPDGTCPTGRSAARD